MSSTSGYSRAESVQICTNYVILQPTSNYMSSAVVWGDKGADLLLYQRFTTNFTTNFKCSSNFTWSVNSDTCLQFMFRNLYWNCALKKQIVETVYTGYTPVGKKRWTQITEHFITITEVTEVTTYYLLLYYKRSHHKVSPTKTITKGLQRLYKSLININITEVTKS
jgi:hypothetical protein